MVNKVILVGNVGIDPEIRTTEGGVKVARIRLATTERLFDRQANEAKEHTEWHTITLWRGLADVVDKYVRKGALPSSLRRPSPPHRLFPQTIRTTCRSDAVRCGRRHGGEVRKKPRRPGGAGCPF